MFCHLLKRSSGLRINQHEAVTESAFPNDMQHHFVALMRFQMLWPQIYKWYQMVSNGVLVSSNASATPRSCSSKSSPQRWVGLYDLQHCYKEQSEGSSIHGNPPCPMGVALSLSVLHCARCSCNFDSKSFLHIFARSENIPPPLRLLRPLCLPCPFVTLVSCYGPLLLCCPFPPWALHSSDRPSYIPVWRYAGWFWHPLYPNSLFYIKNLLHMTIVATILCLSRLPTTPFSADERWVCRRRLNMCFP